MAGSIICGIDDSESAKGAARVARALAGELGLGVTFVRVVEHDASDAKVSAIAERLERLSAGVSDLDCGAAWLIEVGRPADRLVAAAGAAEAVLIVVGSTGPRSSLLGSISADVSRQAPCPVLVVPPGADVRVEGRGERQRDGSESSGAPSRFALGGRGADLAGSIVRFGFDGERRGS
jgi:nucleotide-binding universal stress UspA family protein